MSIFYQKGEFVKLKKDYCHYAKRYNLDEDESYEVLETHWHEVRLFFSADPREDWFPNLMFEVSNKPINYIKEIRI